MTEQKWIQKIADTIMSVHNCDASILEIARQIHEHYKQAGYVRLAEDQTKPHSETAVYRFGEENDGYDEGKRVMYMAMLKANFRKVELEGK